VLPGRYAICRLAPDAPIPGWASSAAFLSITRTRDELSIVCDEAAVPGVKHDRGWRCLRLEGPLDLSLTGVLASVLQPLAAAAVSIFAVATFDTDYLLVPNAQLDSATAALRAAGHAVTARAD
jgi:hypothetical protein